MVSDVFWIDGVWRGRLALLPRPRGGDWLADEVQAWRRAGIDVVVSLLTDDEVTDLGLTHEAETCGAKGIEYRAFPVPDRGVPSSYAAPQSLARSLESKLAAGKNVGIHCRAGIGRSPLLAASLLVLAGLDPGAALERVSAARGVPVPETAEQREWLTHFAQAVLPMPS